MLNKELQSVIYEQRVLVFIELIPQSNRYKQILLTKEQFKQMTATVGKLIHRTGNQEMREIAESEEEYLLPDLQSING